MRQTVINTNSFIDWIFDNRQSWAAGALNLKGAAPLSVLDRAVECYAGYLDESLFQAGLAIREFQEWQSAYRLIFCGQSDVFDRAHRRIVASFENAEILDEYLEMYPDRAQHRETLTHWLKRRNPGQILFLSRAETKVG
ncbi:MAG TPA: hypothetical protein VEK08_19695 [Planctomycetota bacterium]|nr:hypothetical protein [Planctomycetota bacterium]